MRRFILVANRAGQDSQTKEDVLFMTLYRLPNKMSNGGLWHAKKDEALIFTCVNRKARPEQYAEFLNVLPGSLVDVTFGINDFNNKVYVEKMEIVPECLNIHDEDLLYVK